MTTITMASSIFTPSNLCSSPSTSRKSVLFTVSASVFSNTKTTNLRLPRWTSQLGFGPFLPWNGLRQLGISTPPKSLKIEKKGKWRGKAVYASLFGVGAPEALVIGVVALLVFGPKGLAEVARNVGKTLRAFQPTIRELQEVSREFKSTLEREIGLDDIQGSMQNSSAPSSSNPAGATSSPSSSPDSTDPTSSPSSSNSTSASATSSPSSSPSSTDATSTPSSNSTNASATLSPSSTASSRNSDGSPSTNRPYSSEEYLKITEEQLKESAAQQQTQTVTPGESQAEVQISSQDTVQEAAAMMPPPENAGSKA